MTKSSTHSSSTPKRRPRLHAAVALACATAAFGLAGCGSGGDAAAPVLVPTTAPVAALSSVAKYQVVVRNAATGAVVTDATTLTFTASVVNMSGAPITSIVTTDGLASFATAPGVAAGANLRVSAQSRAAGWNDSDATVAVTASADVQLITINLTNATRAAEVPATAPVAVANAPVPVANGATSAPVTLGTPAKTLVGFNGQVVGLASATVQIASGTRITNSAGQAPSGALTLAATVPALNVEGGLSGLPGQQEAGSPVVLGGAITLTAQDAVGNRFTSFSTPVKVRMPLVPQLETQDGSRLLASGDTYPISVWNPTTGNWVVESTAKVVADGTALAAEFETSSFSTRVVRVRPLSACNSTITLTGRPAGNTTPVNVFLSVAACGATDRSTYALGAGNSTPVQLTRTCNRASPLGTARARDSNGALLGTASLANLCEPLSIAVTFAEPTGAINVTTREQCPDGSSNRALPTNVVATPATGTGNPRSVYSTGGTGTISALPAGTYTLKAEGTAGRAALTQTVTVGTTAAAASFVFALQCSVSTGGG